MPRSERSSQWHENQFAPIFQRKRHRIKQIGQFFRVFWSNLCTRHTPDELTPRGHHESRTAALRLATSAG
jgi:hypothetical protein